jgi:type II secretory pathway component PulF
MEATFEPSGEGTNLTQRFRTEGLIPAIAARIFATGSYRGSLRGELATFARLAEREAASGATTAGRSTG